ncbi:MAG: hypothetical protein QOC62_4690 [Mycobacterium sp.]|jgi:serine/threonine protein kinase|nr:hypothetical protein [Mycobacterium sp.]
MTSPRGGSRIGSMFGPYELRSPIGVGGMGEVFEAYDTVRDRMVAVKLLRAELAVDAEFQERFRRESRVAARLEDPHVIPVHDFGEIGGVLYIDMRLVRGINLKETLKRYGPLDPTRAGSIISQVASALDAAHAEGLVHRDVKPENVLLARNDFAYLADFGIVHTSGDASLTKTGAAIGSSVYMAPERFTGGNIGPQADVYALACLLYECLTGQAPFPTKDLGQLMGAHMLAPPPRPSMIRSGLSPTFDDVIARGMAKKPTARFNSAGELARAATAAASNPQPAPARTHPITPTGTRPFSTLYPSPTATGYTPYASTAQAPDIRRDRRGSRWHFLLGAAAIIVLLGVALVAAYAIVRNDDSAPSKGALPPVQTSTKPTTVTEYKTTEPTTTQSTTTTPSTATAPSPTTSGARLAGTDGQGFVGSYARCDSGNTPAAEAQTTKSQVVVCQAGSGTYYYRAVRMSDGATIQLADATRTSGGFDVTNPADGTRYQVRPNVVNIISLSASESEPVVQYASN